MYVQHGTAALKEQYLLCIYLYPTAIARNEAYGVDDAERQTINIMTSCSIAWHVQRIDLLMSFPPSFRYGNNYSRFRLFKSTDANHLKAL
jgi:hypothetical protein